MDADIREAVARKLYEQWSYSDAPDWSAFDESGGDLNPVGLKADSFRESADAVAPFDTYAAVARRMCLNNLIPECYGSKGFVCTEATCTGWRDWLAQATEIVDLVRQQTTK